MHGMRTRRPIEFCVSVFGLMLWIAPGSVFIGDEPIAHWPFVRVRGVATLATSAGTPAARVSGAELVEGVRGRALPAHLGGDGQLARRLSPRSPDRRPAGEGGLASGIGG